MLNPNTFSIASLRGHIVMVNAKHGNSAQSDRRAPAGNQQLICLRSLLINMDNFEPQYGWGFLSNWITVSPPASKYCLELIPLSVARNYLHYTYVWEGAPPPCLNCNLTLWNLGLDILMFLHNMSNYKIYT